MRANIYIRNANQEKWNAISDKSGLVNKILENDDLSEFNLKRDLMAQRGIETNLKVESEEVEGGTKIKLTAIPKKESATCKHGYSLSARLCKKGCR